MAVPAWAPLLHEIVTVEAASETAHGERVTELVAGLRGGGGGGGGAPTPVLRLVEALGPFLTSGEDVQRTRATSVLAEVGAAWRTMAGVETASKCQALGPTCVRSQGLPGCVAAATAAARPPVAVLSCIPHPSVPHNPSTAPTETSSPATLNQPSPWLAQVAEAVPGCAASAGDVAHLAQFFTARLADWPAVRGALRGCLALVARAPAAVTDGAPAATAAGPEAAGAAAAAPALPAPTDEAAVELVRTLVGHVFVRALAQPDRALALRLLAAVAAAYGPALLAANLDLLEYLISSGGRPVHCYACSCRRLPLPASGRLVPRAVLGVQQATAPRTRGAAWLTSPPPPPPSPPSLSRSGWREGPALPAAEL